jgi:ketosteroid isomerase-like protein
MRRKREDEINKIKRLRQREQDAALANDYEAQARLQDSDAVILPPGGPAHVGEENIRAAYAQLKHAYRDVEVIAYEMDLSEPQIEGDYAWEWGSIRGRSRISSSAEVHAGNYQVLRILRRQKNGEWKIFRSIWNLLANEKGSE